MSGRGPRRCSFPFFSLSLSFSVGFSYGAWVGSSVRASVGDQWSIGDHAAQYKPRSETRKQQQRILPEPTQPGSMGGRPVDQCVVVADDGGTPAVRPQPFRHRRQGQAQGGVVITLGIPGHPGSGALWRLPFIFFVICPLVFSPVSPGAHHQRASTGKDAPRIGGPFRIPVGELHVALKALPAAIEKVAESFGEDLSVGDPNCRQTVTPADGHQVIS
jgi:hypothetical protein